MDLGITRSIFLAALVAAAVASARGGGASERDLLALDTLARHGVAPDAETLIVFAANGFSEKVLYNELPEQPPEKCQVLIEAIRLLGKAGDKRAFEPLLAMAGGGLGPGVLRMVQRDTLLAPPAERADARARIVGLLQYNAAVALGLLGDARAVPTLQGLFEQAESPTAKCQYALSMACCGDGGGIDFLVGEIGKANQDSSVAAAQCVFFISGIDFGYRTTSPVKLREKLAEDYTEWWNESRGAFTLDSREAIRRCIDPPPDPTIPPTTVRNLLEIASGRLDPAKAQSARSAVESLESMGPGLDEKLDPILFDQWEDLRVRVEAMRWHVQLKGKKAKKALKKLAKDENPEIVQFARDRLDGIADGALTRESDLGAEILIGGKPVPAQAP